MHTTVINLWGGAGLGKSTLAAEIFYKLKQQNVSCELVREYVKELAWAGKKLTTFDQFGILRTQSDREELLYNKVKYIITDCPISLVGFYTEHYSDNKAFSGIIKEYIDNLSKKDVTHVNYVLNRNKVYNPIGRYETEEEAKAIDGKIIEYLVNNKYEFIKLDLSDNEKANYIISSLTN